MAREFQYNIPKSDVLDKCRKILVKLDYDIDIYAAESDMLITKPIQLRGALRRYDYVIYVQVSDRINIQVAAERSIFKRGSQSTVGGSGQIEKQSDPAMPYRLQQKIFNPIYNGMIRNDFRPK
ncbi:MAG: hypothetical protein ISR82_02725 [Candidatus Marinimicrobia bacterium]|nr:hypothetical protein [Candidatus Neomarinimicrobiota bacterium]MBL7010116.1 hypothetical protein [Candidatus Neomarinimicrobiota bacterium]MBL7029973.1 hypothetical protein [Candidatus Neomarinimicrobiota bacterium]